MDIQIDIHPCVLQYKMAEFCLPPAANWFREDVTKIMVDKGEGDNFFSSNGKKSLNFCWKIENIMCR